MISWCDPDGDPAASGWPLKLRDVMKRRFSLSPTHVVHWVATCCSGCVLHMTLRYTLENMSPRSGHDPCPGGALALPYKLCLKEVCNMCCVVQVCSGPAQCMSAKLAGWATIFRHPSQFGAMGVCPSKFDVPCGESSG